MSSPLALRHSNISPTPSPLASPSRRMNPSNSRTDIISASHAGWGGARSSPASSPTKSSTSPDPAVPIGAGVESTRRRTSSSFKHVRTNNLVKNSPFKNLGGAASPPPVSAGARPQHQQLRGLGLGLHPAHSPHRQARKPSRENSPPPKMMRGDSNSSLEDAAATLTTTHTSKAKPRQSKGFALLDKAHRVSQSPWKARELGGGVISPLAASTTSESDEEESENEEESTTPYEESETDSSPARPTTPPPPAVLRSSATTPTPKKSNLTPSRRLQGPRSSAECRERRKTVTFGERPDVREFEKDSEAGYEESAVASDDEEREIEHEVAEEQEQKMPVWQLPPLSYDEEADLSHEYEHELRERSQSPELHPPSHPHDAPSLEDIESPDPGSYYSDSGSDSGSAMDELVDSILADELLTGGGGSTTTTTSPDLSSAPLSPPWYPASTPRKTHISPLRPTPQHRTAAVPQPDLPQSPAPSFVETRDAHFPSSGASRDIAGFARAQVHQDGTLLDPFITPQTMIAAVASPKARRGLPSPPQRRQEGSIQFAASPQPKSKKASPSPPSPELEFTSPPLVPTPAFPTNQPAPAPAPALLPELPVSSPLWALSPRAHTTAPHTDDTPAPFTSPSVGSGSLTRRRRLEEAVQAKLRQREASVEEEPAQLAEPVRVPLPSSSSMSFEEAQIETAQVGHRTSPPTEPAPLPTTTTAPSTPSKPSPTSARTPTSSPAPASSSPSSGPVQLSTAFAPSPGRTSLTPGPEGLELADELSGLDRLVASVSPPPPTPSKARPAPFHVRKGSFQQVQRRAVVVDSDSDSEVESVSEQEEEEGEAAGSQTPSTLTPKDLPGNANLKDRENAILLARRKSRAEKCEGRASRRRSLSVDAGETQLKRRTAPPVFRPSSGLPAPKVAMEETFGDELGRELNAIFDNKDRKYNLREHSEIYVASSGADEKVAHSRTAGDVDSGKAWRVVRRPSDMNEYSRHLKEVRKSEKFSEATGKVFVKVVGIRDLEIPVPAKPTFFCCMLDNGINHVATPFTTLKQNAPIGQEFDLILNKNLFFTLALKARVDPHLQPPPPPPRLVSVPSAPIPPPPKSHSGLRSLFGSPKKDKKLRAAAAAAPTAAAPPPPPTPPVEPLKRYLAKDGTFAATRVVYADVAPKCQGRVLELVLPLYGQRAAADSPSLARARAGDLGVPAAHRGTTKCVVGKLVLHVLAIPSLPGVRQRDLPQCLDHTVKAMREIQWHKKKLCSGILTQLGGGCSSWKRRLFQLVGGRIIAFNDVTRKPITQIDLTKAVSVEDCQDVSPTSGRKYYDDDGSDLNGVERSFRIVFDDGEGIAFFADSDEDKATWLKELRSLVGRIPPKPLWAQALEARMSPAPSSIPVPTSRAAATSTATAKRSDSIASTSTSASSTGSLPRRPSVQDAMQSRLPMPAPRPSSLQPGRK